MPVTDTVFRQLLCGRDRRATKVGLFTGVAMFVVSYLFWRIPGISESAYELLPVDVIGGGFALVLVLAAVQASLNQGLIISVLLVFFPGFGATVNFVGVGLQSPNVAESIALIVGIPLVAALLLGTVGYLLGRGFKHILHSAGSIDTN